MPSSTSSSEPGHLRPVPDLPWPAIALTVAIVAVMAVAAWELHCRALGYTPGLNDTSDLWVEARRNVRPDSVVIVGSSRGLFDLDLDALAQGLGSRPVQLSLVGSCPYPILRELADDHSFHGTVLCDIVPALLLPPPQAPPYQNAMKAVERLRTQTWSQWAGQLLSMPLNRTFACMQQDDLTLSALLHRLALPNRPRAQIGPELPPCFSTIERDRRTRMSPRVLTDQVLRDRVKNGWPPLFTPPPKPSWIPDAAFMAFIGKMVDGRFADMAQAVADLRARGGRVVFLREPSSGDLRTLEEQLHPPGTVVWNRLLAATGCPGISYADHPELAGFTCPEWSHLSAEDSVTYSTSLAPLLEQVLRGQGHPPAP